MNFFDHYPRFYQTSTVGANPNRLNARHRVLIEENADCLRGARILDLASHDGRWSFAALKAGSRHVLGIEIQSSLTEAAQETFRAYGIASDAYRFETSDVYRRLPDIPACSIDTVFCFGLLYHTAHHQLLFAELARIRPKHLIVDSCICKSPDAIVELKIERAANSSDHSYREARPSVVGYPSRRALEMMLTNCGFGIRYFNWRSIAIQNWHQIEDYRDGIRVTLRADFIG
jgi:hypothetical protein